MKRVLITSRSFGMASDEPYRMLERAGFDVTHIKIFTDEEFLQAATGIDALILGVNPFGPRELRVCPNLKIIARYGAGVNNIDLPAIKASGIPVTYLPGVNTNAVADYTIGLILDASRNISGVRHTVLGGAYEYTTGKDVYGKTLGLVGFGAVGQAVARRAKGFSMRILAYDPFVQQIPAEFQGNVTLCDRQTVTTQSDIISIHAALTDETRDMFNKTTIRTMKQDAVLINTARGGIVNEQDLYDCMRTGHLFAAALDVQQNEPIERDNPLLTLGNVIITPHAATVTRETIDAMSTICAQNVINAFTGKTLQYPLI